MQYYIAEIAEIAIVGLPRAKPLFLSPMPTRPSNTPFCVVNGGVLATLNDSAFSLNLHLAPSPAFRSRQR